MIKPKLRKGRILMIIAALMMLAAACIAGCNYYEEMNSYRDSNDTLKQLVTVISNGNGEKPIFGESGIISEGDLPYTDGFDTEPERYINIEGYDYIGYLSIPSVELETPIMADWDYGKLKKSPCRYFGTAKGKDLVIAGHSYRRGFLKIRDLKIGDIVYFIDADNRRYTYKVCDAEILQPTDTAKMVESGWDLSLYTCVYSGSERYTVRCTLIEDN